MAQTICGDTLVIQFKEYSVSTEEHPREKYNLMRDIYLFYDHEDKKFAVRGYVPLDSFFSFYFFSDNDVVEFLTNILSDFQLLDMYVLSYPDLPLETNDITYDALEDLETGETVISHKKYKNKYALNIRSFVNMVRGAYNDYRAAVEMVEIDMD